uniref:Uncharacterized protein n=1 Tax=Knipowitschia caucasica TaxID=637954 RepID=A0AAV2MN65_KNICA
MSLVRALLSRAGVHVSRVPHAQVRTRGSWSRPQDQRSPCRSQVRDIKARVSGFLNVKLQGSAATAAAWTRGLSTSPRCGPCGHSSVSPYLNRSTVVQDNEASTDDVLSHQIMLRPLSLSGVGDGTSLLKLRDLPQQDHPPPHTHLREGGEGLFMTRVS